MRADLDDFCLWTSCMIDELWQPIAPLFQRPGPPPVWSDSALSTMALAGECCGWDPETELISHWQRRRDVFPHVPERSRFNRRRTALQQGITLIRCLVLRLLDLAQKRHCAIESVPVPVVQVHLVPGASRDWKVDGTSFGNVVTNKQTFFGYKLHLVVTVNGVLLAFELAAAHVPDRTVGAELLSEHHDLTVLGDKGYLSAAPADELATSAAFSCLPRRAETRASTCLRASRVCGTRDGKSVRGCTTS